MSVEWLVPALADLDQIFDYILESNPQAAIKIHETIRHQTGVLANHPQLGRKGRISGTRELVIVGLPYIVVYYLKNQKAYILAVFHTSRQFPPAFKLE